MCRSCRLSLPYWYAAEAQSRASNSTPVRGPAPSAGAGKCPAPLRWRRTGDIAPYLQYCKYTAQPGSRGRRPAGALKMNSTRPVFLLGRRRAYLTQLQAAAINAYFHHGMPPIGNFPAASSAGVHRAGELPHDLRSVIHYDSLIFNRISGHEAQVKARLQRVLGAEKDRGLDRLPVGADLPEEVSLYSSPPLPSRWVGNHDNALTKFSRRI